MSVLPPWRHIALSAGIGLALHFAAAAVAWKLDFAIVFVVPLAIAGTTFLVAAGLATLDRFHDRRAGGSAS